MNWQLTLSVVIAVATLVASTATLVWFVSVQFSSNRSLMWKAITEASKEIITKLEYHERHDDERFSEMAKDIAIRHQSTNNRIWNIELRNAAKDGTLPTEYRKND